MSHVLDDLELYATGALTADAAKAVARHVEECAECRRAEAEIAEVVALLADAVPPREPPADLRQRVLAAARADVARAPRVSLLDRIRPRLGTLALAAAVVALIGADANATIRARDAQTQLATWSERFSHADRSWYMAGVDGWKGAGGSLVVQSNERTPFVLFHDLRGLPAGQVYAVWLISPEGRWLRATSFTSDGNKYQLVDVGVELSGFDRCAVTVEPSASGGREGPIVMQSRIAPAAR